MTMAGQDRRGARDSLAALRQTAIFGGLEADVLEVVARLSVWRDWPAETLLFQRGDEGNHMVIVASGRLRMSLVSAAGREMMLGALGPGGVIGELALIDGQPRSADVTTMEPSSGLILWRDGFLSAMQMEPRLGLAVARHLCGLLRATNHQMESIALHDLRTRLVRFLLFALEQARGTDLPSRAELRIGLNQTELANMLGASRPKVNRALQALIEDGAVTRVEDRLICDIALLRAFAEAGEAGE